jgi:hypothetical protein
MFRYILISLALISFSIVSNATVIPMDADQAVSDAIQNAVLHKEVVLVQGGGADKDVADVPSAIGMHSCRDDAACSTASVHQSLGDWFAQDSSGGSPRLIGWLIILGSVAFFLSCKSASTK